MRNFVLSPRSYMKACLMIKSVALYHQLRRARASRETGDGFSSLLSGMEHWWNDPSG